MSEVPNTPPPDPSLFSDRKNLIVIGILMFLILTFIGVNILSYSGNVLEKTGHVFGPMLANLLSMLGVSTGELINHASDTLAKGANLGVDIAKGTTHSIGDLLIGTSKPGLSPSVNLDHALDMPRIEKDSTKESLDTNPQPISTTDPVVAQNLTSGWCYVGDFNGTRGCVEFNHVGCASGQTFPNQAACLAPLKMANN